MLVIGALALFAAVALAGLTNKLQRIGTATSAAVESVRLGHEVQIELMLDERVEDELVRTDIEADLQRRLVQAHEHVSSTVERDLLAQAESSIDEYLAAEAAGIDEPRLSEVRAAAHADLREFVDLNVHESRAASDLAARWNTIADVLAIALILANLTAGGWLMWWMRARAIAPLLELTDTVERFGRGDKDARADESGPLELSEVAARFNQMADALASQRSAQMAHLAAVAHDLRNPLWALQLSLDAARASEPTDEARTRRGLDAAQRQVDRLGRMIDDLLDASNIEAGHLELRRGMHDVGEIVRELGEQFAGTSAKHRIEWCVPQEPVVAVVDPMRVGQVVTNLLTNAVKYSPAGGAVRLELRREGEAAVISVADDGLGIDAVDLPDVFEPFHRLVSGKRSGAGSGLGLFVVRRIVQAHGGEIDVESAPGHGSKFRVRLPLLQSGITRDEDVVRAGGE